MDEHLEILGLNYNSLSHENIKSKYKQLTLKHHPDKNGDTAFYRTVIEASDYLIAYVDKFIKVCIYPSCELRRASNNNYCDKHLKIKKEQCIYMNYSSTAG